MLEELLDDGWSLVMYAEGTRSRDGSGRPAARRRRRARRPSAGCRSCPCTSRARTRSMPVGRGWMRRGPGFGGATSGSRFGPPIRPTEGRAPHRGHGARAAFLAAEGAATPDAAALRRAAQPTMARSSSPAAAASSAARCAARLQEGGDEVARARALAARRREGRRARRRAVRGDVLDEDRLAAGMDGCEVAYHVAGVNTHCPHDPDC